MKLPALRFGAPGLRSAVRSALLRAFEYRQHPPLAALFDASA
jgi:hypothetical protein